MTDKPENPYAFPVQDTITHDGFGLREGATGMSLRDWFAGQALSGIMSNMEYMSALGQASKLLISDDDSAFPVVAAAAFEVADAMLAERAKEQG